MQFVHCLTVATCTFALIVSSSPINEPSSVYTLNEKPLQNDANDDNIPLIVFEASLGNRSDIDDCYNNDCSDRDLEVDLLDSNEFESMQQQTEPTHGSDQIQLKPSNGDSDTVFFISNTEVKMLDINPTTHFKHQEAAITSPPSIYENFAIDVTENFTEVLKEERGGNFINTPIVHFINNMSKHNFTILQLDPKNETAANRTLLDGGGGAEEANITTLTVINGAEPEPENSECTENFFNACVCIFQVFSLEKVIEEKFRQV